MLLVIVVILLLVASGYFSACETSISVASKAKLHQLAKEKGSRSAIAEKLKDQMTYMISAILMCNTVLNTVATAITSSICKTTFGDHGVIYASFVMSCLILIYAEVMPKMLAIDNPEKIVVCSAYLLRVFLFVCAPISKATNWIARKTLALVGVHAKHNASNLDSSNEELRGVIDLHRGPDQDTAQERSMLKSVLDLKLVNVCEIMVHRKNVTMLSADDPIESIVDQVLASPFSRVPLWKGDPDNIVGVVNVKMLLRSVRAMPEKISEIDITKIAHKPWFIPDSTDLLEQLQMFRKRREHFAIVVDEYGALMGVVTLEDILEEIVGEIDDEHDISVKGVRPQPNGALVIDGSVTIRDLNREFDWDLPDDSAATIAGLLINTVRMIPEEGQVFMLYGFRLTVLKRQKNQITLIKMVKCDALDGATEQDE